MLILDTLETLFFWPYSFIDFKIPFLKAFSCDPPSGVSIVLQNDIKEDFWTGGHGIKLGKDHKAPEGGYTDEYWNKKFNERFTEAHNGALKLVGTDMDYRVTGVLTEMIYQIGYTGVSKFKNTLKYMENGQWDLASNEMLNSKWAVQTPQRAKDLAKIIKNIR